MDVHRVVAACVEVNSRALAYGGVVVVPGLRTRDDASLPLGVVVVGANCPLRLP